MKTGIFFIIGWLSVFCFYDILADPIEDMVSRRYTYETLSAYQRMLLDDFIEAEFPAGSKLADALTDHTSLRVKTRLAQALMFRNKTNDTENALVVIRWILKFQHLDETNRNYGIWRTSVANDRLDQNWREFIGCDLIIIYHFYKNRIPADLLADIETGLIHAARGAMKRNVGADYTNISIMSAFLMNFVGTEFKQPLLGVAGLKKAKEVVALYNRHETFSEYNSPTYYGVTLVALALWRELGISAELKQMGRTLETAFWKEISTFYNANLKNMPAPYFRGYGMDMQKYYSITGLWMAVALDNKEMAPIPSKHGPKFDEVSNISSIYHLGLEIPEINLRQLRSFTVPRYLERTVPNTYPGDSLKYVTAMINKDWMMGGVWGNRKPWNQVKTGAIHWKNGDSDIAWLLVPGDGNTNVKVTRSVMKVYLANPAARQVQFFAYAKDINVSTIADRTWTLPGMVLKISTKLKRIKTEAIDADDFRSKQAVSDVLPSVINVAYEIPASWNPADPLVEIVPSKK
jgi:hypothetical protein